MAKEHLYLGRVGEELAADFLKKNGYRILARNYKTKLGEIDIIARDKQTVCFIEVKTRQSSNFGLPQEAVFKAKQRQIAKAALVFLKENRLLEKSARFDVVSVMSSEDAPKIELIKNAFELDESYVV